MKRKHLHLCSIIILFMLCCFIVPSTIKAANANTNGYQLEKVDLKSTEVKRGSKVYIDVFPKQGLENVTSLKLEFYGNKDNRSFSVPIENLNTSQPYFIVPNDLTVGSKYDIFYADMSAKTNFYKYGYDEIQFANNKKSITIIDDKTITVKLDHISLQGNKNFQIGEKVYFNLVTKGYVTNVCLSFYNKKLNKSFDAFVRDLDSQPYIDTSNGSETIVPGDYELTNVLVSSLSGEMLHYSKATIGQNILPLNFDVKITAKNPNDTEVPETDILKSISLKSQTAKLNEKVYVDLTTNGSAKKVMLSFVDQKNDKNMIVYLKSIDHNPYFVVPYTTDASEYTLDYMVITDKNMQTHHYRQGEDYNGIKHFDFNSKIQIENAINADNNLIDIDNSKLTDDLIQKIKEMDSNVVITIEASANPIIKSAVFEAIKGSNKIIIVKYNENEWIFNGMDVKTPKDINVSVSITKADQKGSIDVSSMMQKGLVLNYADNGELPAKALVRISATDEMKEYLGNEKAYVYYYDENGNKLDKVAMEISLSDDGFYEFYINHNSSYVITTEKVDSQYVSNNTDDLKLNSTLSNDKTDLLNNSGVTQNNQEKTLQIAIVVAVAVIVILIITIIVIISRRKK